MDYYSSHDSPSRYGSDGYRRASPGYVDRRSRIRSRSPHSIDRYQPSDRPSDRPRDRDRDRDRDHRDRDRERDRDRDRDRNDRDRDVYFKRRDDPPRRRSPAPVANIDRYVPGQEPVAPPPLMTNPMPNPTTLDTPVGFTYFAEWWRLEQQVQDERDRQKYGSIRPERLKDREEKGKDREQIQAAYDVYKEKYHLQVLKTFIQQHKNDEWFKEKYDPDTRQLSAENLARIRQEAYFRWTEEIDSGVFDNFTLEGVHKHDANAGTNGMADREEGETTGGNELLGVSDLVAAPGCDLRDPSLQYPTLLIKTIAPTVSRARLEDFCREHLGVGEGGYKWLSLSDPNPLKKYHRIGWVVLNGNPKTGDDGDDVMGEDNTPARALEALNGKTVMDEIRGDFTCHVGIHEPPNSPRKKALWDLFSAPERVERDLELASRLVEKFDATLGEGYSGLSKVEAKVDEIRSMGLLKSSSSSHSAPAPDSDQEEGQDNEEEEGQYDADEDEPEEYLVQKKKLDLLVEYLRRVFHFCFFCVFESDSVHELTRKCPGGHLRRPRSCLTSSGKLVARASARSEPFPLKKNDSSIDKDDILAPPSATDDQPSAIKPSSKTQQQLHRAYNWVKSYEERLMQVLTPDKVDLRKLGGRPLEEALEEDLARYVKQEDEAKYRCKLPECTKLFKAYHFWRKHVEKRHDEFFLNIRRDIEAINAYVLDPGHLAPPHARLDLSATHPHLSQSTGFSPRSGSMASFSPGMGLIPGFPGMFGTPHGNRDGNTLNRAGPIRNNRNPRTSNVYSRQSGPYSRPDTDRRASGVGNGTGHGSPSRGAERRFPDVPQGAPAGVGRDAVQGRSLKSYEDLDATSQGGAGQLDY